MNWTVLLAVIAFKGSGYVVQHYPMQANAWVSKVEYNQKSKGQLKVRFKDNTWHDVPKCRWSALDTSSTAIGNITYYSRNEIGLSFFEKQKKKDVPKDFSFLLSCKEQKNL